MTSALVRAGWLIKPTLLIYGVAGWSGAMMEYANVSGSDDWYNPKGQFWANGWSLGSGLEHKLTEHWALRAEYRLTHFPTTTEHNNFQQVAVGNAHSWASQFTSAADLHTASEG